MVKNTMYFQKVAFSSCSDKGQIAKTLELFWTRAIKLLMEDGRFSISDFTGILILENYSWS